MISYITIGLIALNFTLTIVTAILYSSKTKQLKDCKLSRIVKSLYLVKEQLDDFKNDRVSDLTRPGTVVDLSSINQMVEDTLKCSCPNKHHKNNKVKSKEDLMLEDLLNELLKNKEAIREIRSAIVSSEDEKPSSDDNSTDN